MFFNATDIHIVIIYEKMNHIDKERAVFEKLPLSDFKMRSSAALKAFNNYSIIMTNKSDVIIISSLQMLLLLLLIFELT